MCLAIEFDGDDYRDVSLHQSIEELIADVASRIDYYESYEGYLIGKYDVYHITVIGDVGIQAGRYAILDEMIRFYEAKGE